MTLTYQDLCKEDSNNSINNDSQDSFCLEGLNKIGIGERKLNKAPINTELKSETYESCKSRNPKSEFNTESKKSFFRNHLTPL